MAKCPACGRKLHIWNFRPECPGCNIDIPNYKFEQGLERDAEIAAFHRGRLKVRTTAFKSALFGNRLRITRDVFVFVPLIFMLVPLFTVSVGDIRNAIVSMLKFILAIVNGEVKLGTFLSFLGVSGSESLIALSILLAFLSIAFGVLNFFLVIVGALKFYWLPNVIACVLSDVCVIASAVVFNMSGSGRVSPFIGVGLLLFSVNIIFNILCGHDYQEEKTQLLNNPYITADKAAYQ